MQNLYPPQGTIPNPTVFTMAQRDALPSEERWFGRMIFNSTVGKHEWWDGAAWKAFGGGASGFARQFAMRG